MALHRRVLQDVKFVCSFDPAIESGYLEYKAAGYDFSKLVLKEKQRATVFYLCQMTSAQKNFVDNYSGRQQQYFKIQCALTKLDEYSTVSSAGDVRPMPDVKREDHVLGKMAADDWMALADFHGDILDEVSAAIDETSNPSPF